MRICRRFGADFFTFLIKIQHDFITTEVLLGLINLFKAPQEKNKLLFWTSW